MVSPLTRGSADRRSAAGQPAGEQLVERSPGAIDLCVVIDEDVANDEQDACLDALAATAPPWTWDRIPAACTSTWTVVP